MLSELCPTVSLEPVPLSGSGAAVRCAPAPAPDAGPGPHAGSASSLTVTIVYDNYVHDPRLATGWGFACHVDYGGHVLMFDTGNDASPLLSNMRILGLDCERIETVVLSHNHEDHTGGLAGLLAQTRGPRVLVPTSFSGSQQQQMTAAGADPVMVHGPVRIAAGVWSTGELGSSIREQALVLESSVGLVVITGCAHPGIVKIVARVKQILPGRAVYLVLGGFHLGGQSDSSLKSVIAGLRHLGVERVAPCHCSGDRARSLFATSDEVDGMMVGAGWQIEIGPRQ